MSLSAILLVFASATATTASTPAEPVDPLDKVKCVRETVTGSLVSTRKVCHTVREWRRIAGDAGEEARRITQPGTPYQSN
jgi:hypothetical protein